MKKYNVMYLKKAIQICFCLSLPIAVLFLVFAISGGENLAVFEIMAMVAVTAFAPPALLALYMAWRLQQINRMVEIQENQFGLQFPAADAKCLSQNAMPPVYATQDVLIISGQLTLHRAFIKAWKSTGQHYSKGAQYVFRFACANGKTYRATLSDTGSVKAIRKWAASVPQTAKEMEQEKG